MASLTACLEAVRAGRADQALIPLLDGVNTGELHVDIIGTDRLQLMASPKIAKQIVVKQKTLHGPLLLYPPGNAYGSVVDRMLSTEGMRLEQDAVCESSSAEALYALAVNHMGAAWLPHTLSSDQLVPCTVPKALSWAYDIVLVSA